MKKKISSLSTRPRPLQILGPREKEESSRELQISGTTSHVFSSAFKLPRGLAAEERPRINSPCHPDRVDKTNISDEDLPLRITVKQQKDTKKIKVTSRALKPGNHYVYVDNSVSSKNYVSHEEGSAWTLNCGSLPEKVKWVLSGPGANVWNLSWVNL